MKKACQRKVFIAIYCLLLCCVFPMQAQWMGGQLSEREKQGFEQRVKEIGHFMQRFNNFEKQVIDQAQMVPVADSMRVLYRTRAILHLLDYNKYSQSDDVTKEQVRSFIDQVNQERQYLDFYDNDWYALVTLEATFQGQATVLNLTLKNESTADKVSKWVIVGAQAGFLKLPPADTKLFLPPNSDGTNFTGLSGALQEAKKAPSYAYTGFEADAMTLLFMHMQLGALQVGNVKSVNFHFLQVAGWSMVVSEFNELQPYGSGWLISDLKPILSRESYKQAILHMTHRQ